MQCQVPHPARAAPQRPARPAPCEPYAPRLGATAGRRSFRYTCTPAPAREKELGIAATA